MLANLSLQDTKFLQIANVCRTKFKVDASKDLFCVFDGDHLEPEGDVQSLELEQEESLEVVIRDKKAG